MPILDDMLDGLNTLTSLMDDLFNLDMMTLGQFVFNLNTVPYQEMQHSAGWRHPSSSRVGLRPGYQFIGPDEETVTLSGVLLPTFTGGQSSLDELRAMADTGKAWPLIDGTGTLYGLFVIEKLDQTRSEFFSDGAARRIEFTLNLKRVDDDNVDQLGSLLDIPGAIYL